VVNVEVGPVAACTLLARPTPVQYLSRSSSPEILTLLSRVAALFTAEADKAREVFGAVPTKNVWHHTAFIGALGACGQWEAALAALQHLKQLAYADRSLQPNHVTYSAAIAACAQVRRLDVALQLFHEMQAAGGCHAVPGFPPDLSALRRRYTEHLDTRQALRCGVDSAVTAGLAGGTGSLWVVLIQQHCHAVLLLLRHKGTAAGCSPSPVSATSSNCFSNVSALQPSIYQVHNAVCPVLLLLLLVHSAGLTLCGSISPVSATDFNVLALLSALHA
jgi:pentatricopeptide repeat protein